MRVVKNIFEPRASRTLRVLLSNPGKAWTIRELAHEAQVSPGYTHALTTTLIQNGYVARNKVYRIEVVDPIRMLKRWSSYHQYDATNTFLDYYTFEKEIDRLVDRLREVRREYALTGLVGAWLVAPSVRPVIVEAYVQGEEEARRLAEALELKPTPKQGNVRLVIPYDVGVFYKTQTIDRVQVVSNVQLYVDLYNYPARGEEAATHIFEVIQKAWGEALLRGTTYV